MAAYRGKHSRKSAGSGRERGLPPIEELQQDRQAANSLQREQAAGNSPQPEKAVGSGFQPVKPAASSFQPVKPAGNGLPSGQATSSLQPEKAVSSLQPEKAASSLQPELSATASPLLEKTPRRLRGKRRKAQIAALNAASPDAYKEHDAVQEIEERSRHSKRKTFLIVVPLVLALVALAIGGVVAARTLVAEEVEEIPAGIAVTVTIPHGATATQIADLLKKTKVISDIQEFRSAVISRGVEQSLKPGVYELETFMDTTVLIDLLVAGPMDGGVKLTIPEGLTVEQTARIVENVCGIPLADFLVKAYAANEYAADYPFLKDVYNNSLEGFLFPKTYMIPKDATADLVIRKLLDQFIIETSNLDLTYAQDHGMNLFHVVTMASLIERETAVPDERPQIASVIYNRLRAGMRLQIDATVIYALGPDYSGLGVSYEDLEVESPYNTYRVDELPAGPICSPGIESIEAAAHPASTDYYYYVLTSKEGRHTFCTTSEEFEAAKEQHNLLFGIE